RGGGPRRGLSPPPPPRGGGPRRGLSPPPPPRGGGPRWGLSLLLSLIAQLLQMRHEEKVDGGALPQPPPARREAREQWPSIVSNRNSVKKAHSALLPRPAGEDQGGGYS